MKVCPVCGSDDFGTRNRRAIYCSPRCTQQASKTAHRARVAVNGAMTHSYAGYTAGCRCETCRQAKADYMREQRAAGRAKAAPYTRSSTGKRGAKGNARKPGATRYVTSAADVRHGSRHAYEVHGCRCFPCTDARIESDRKYRRSA